MRDQLSCYFVCLSYLLFLILIFKLLFNFNLFFFCLLGGLLLSVFEFRSVTFSFWGLLSIFLSLFGHFVNFLTLKSVSPVFVLILKNSFVHFIV